MCFPLRWFILELSHALLFLHYMRIFNALNWDNVMGEEQKRETTGKLQVMIQVKEHLIWPPTRHYTYSAQQSNSIYWHQPSVLTVTAQTSPAPSKFKYVNIYKDNLQTAQNSVRFQSNLHWSQLETQTGNHTPDIYREHTHARTRTHIRTQSGLYSSHWGRSRACSRKHAKRKWFFTAADRGKKNDVFLKFIKFDRIFHFTVKSFTPRDGAKVVLLCLGFPNRECHCEEITGQKKEEKEEGGRGTKK